MGCIGCPETSSLCDDVKTIDFKTADDTEGNFDENQAPPPEMRKTIHLRRSVLLCNTNKNKNEIL